MRKICFFTATRAEYGLLKPIMSRLRDMPDVRLQVYVSGTHLSASHGMTVDEIIQDGFSIDARSEILLSSASTASVGLSMGLAVSQYTLKLQELAPDLLVILGDRYEAFCAAAAATVHVVPIAHIHGGETTLGAMDDAFRHCITKMSHLHFTACEAYRRRVVQLGEQPDHVWNAGALGVENALTLTLPSESEIRACLGIPPQRPYILATFHPTTLEPGRELSHLEALLTALDAFPEHVAAFTAANADPGGDGINTRLRRWAAADADRRRFFPSLGVARYLASARNAACVVGNSSSGIIEIPSLGTPVLDIGNRQQGRLRSPAVRHCEPTVDAVTHALALVMTPEYRNVAAHTANPYEKPGTSAAIAQILHNYSLHTLQKKYFYSIDVPI